MTDHSKPIGWYCAKCAFPLVDDGMLWCKNCNQPWVLAAARSVRCTCGTMCIPVYAPLAKPEPSMIRDMAELEVVTVPLPWSVHAWFMSSDARRSDFDERCASTIWYSESDIPRIAETSARLREEDR